MLVPSEDIKTKEVLDWRGLHLLHFPMSSCSQKVRILLGEKHLPWTSHVIDLRKKVQKDDWYLGINKHGVVPVLVHDGRVYNESNDILRYLDETFPSEDGSWFPESDEEKQSARDLLDLEDGLHHDLRAITFTYVMPGKLMDEQPTAEEAAQAVRRFDEVFTELERTLSTSAYLCGDRIMIPDIAWFINLHRLQLGGYPLDRLPHLNNYYQKLRSRPAFRKEISAGPKVAHLITPILRTFNKLTGASMASRLAGDAS